MRKLLQEVPVLVQPKEYDDSNAETRPRTSLLHPLALTRPHTLGHMAMRAAVCSITVRSIRVRCSAVRYIATVALLAIGYLVVSGTQPCRAAGFGDRNENQQAVTAAKVAASPLDLPARSWVVEVAANELVALHHPGSYLRYRMHVHDEKGDQVRDVIESKDGSVARLILKEGRPLTDAEDKAEQDRLNAMIAAPADYYHHVKNEESSRKIADAMIRLMPDAMLSITSRTWSPFSS